jgi:hypothetical protein
VIGLEKWLLHKTTKTYNYFNCLQTATHPRIKQLWERFLDYELGHLHFVAGLFEQTERREAAEILPASLLEPLRYESHREFIRSSPPRNSPDGAFVERSKETAHTRAYRVQLNAEGSPSELVAAGCIWMPGTELAGQAKMQTPSMAAQPWPPEERRMRPRPLWITPAGTLLSPARGKLV